MKSDEDIFDLAGRRNIHEKLRIYCDNEIEADWFRNLNPRFKGLSSYRIERRGKNPGLIDRLIAYDRPDIILTDGEEALLVVEKTAEVPTGHNVGQRMARLVRAAEENIPVIFFFPFDARKHGKHTGICNMNIRLLLAFEKMWEIHNSPILAVNWPVDPHGELLDDGSEDERLRDILGKFVTDSFSSSSEIFRGVRLSMKNEYEERLEVRPQYENTPTSVKRIKTKRFLDSLSFDVPAGLREECSVHGESLVYKINMSEDKCRREDPYTGMQFIYDYIFCRSGASPEEKHRNLILHFPNIRKRIWQDKNPNDPYRKSSNWYLTANALVFSDGILPVKLSDGLAAR